MYCVLCIVVIRNTYCVLCIVYCVILVIRNTVIRNTACAYVRSNITVRVYVCACCITVCAHARVLNGWLIGLQKHRRLYPRLILRRLAPKGSEDYGRSGTLLQSRQNDIHKDALLVRRP